MKKIILLSLALIATLSVSAQYYPNGKPIPPRHRYGYNSHRSSGSFLDDTYYGFRLGLNVASVHSDAAHHAGSDTRTGRHRRADLRTPPPSSTVHSDAAILDGSDSRTGLDLGAVVGTRLTSSAPLYFETGLSYTEKGGKGTYAGNKFTYRLEYLELPLVLKYKYAVAPDITIEPFAGGYLALGVGGKIKNNGARAP